MPILEICVDSVASSVAAESGGAQRIELCSALSEGGLTPSLGLLRAVRSSIRIGIHVMVRPRGGDFCYSDDEFSVMCEDITLAAQSGANGVVIGLLTGEGDVDVERTQALVELARPMQVTFHRAIDVTRDPVQALEAIIQTRADRVLTSGGEPSAMLGHSRIRELVNASRQRIRVMGGGGVRAENVAHLAGITGADEWHAALRRPVADENLAERIAELGNGYAIAPVQAEQVQALRRALDDAFQPRAGVGSDILAGPSLHEGGTHGVEN